MNILRPHHESLEIPESEIQKEAHRLWLEKGRPGGRDLEIWLEAKEHLKHRLRLEASPSGTVSAPPSLKLKGKGR